MDKLYTIGEFSRKANVTQRTLRFYDKIGLLKPSLYKAGGRRYYGSQDFAKLQKILTLKFIGMSLDEIGRIMRYDVNKEDFIKSLEIQRNIIDKKIHHMQLVESTIDEALNAAGCDDTLDWDRFIKIINVINTENNWMEQYENASNLRARIRIHELYSINSKGWMEWFFEQLSIPQNARILELGCGDGSLWAKNRDRIPEGWDIYLTDFSQGMLKDAQNMLGSKSLRFKFNVVDAQNIPYDDGTFDTVIANHMLYHVSDIDKAFSEIYRVLKPGGHFYSSTVGKNHMAELRGIIEKFIPEMTNSQSLKHTEKFQLENGLEKVAAWFKNVDVKRYEDSLLVTQPAPIIDYIFSMPGNMKEAITAEKYDDLLKYLEHEINIYGAIHITKDTGFFHGMK